jgi:hypothetical protein
MGKLFERWSALIRRRFLHGEGVISWCIVLIQNPAIPSSLFLGTRLVLFINRLTLRHPFNHTASNFLFYVNIFIYIYIHLYEYTHIKKEVSLPHPVWLLISKKTVPVTFTCEFLVLVSFSVKWVSYDASIAFSFPDRIEKSVSLHVIRFSSTSSCSVSHSMM